MGLPGEQPEDTLITYKKVLGLGVSDQGSPSAYRQGYPDGTTVEAGRLPSWQWTTTSRCSQRLSAPRPNDLLFHRLTGSDTQEYLLAPQWVLNKRETLNAVYRKAGSDL